MLPVVLHHGILGYDTLRLGPIRVKYFTGIDRAIAGRGYPVIVTRVHPTASIQIRAGQLKRMIFDRLKLLGAAEDRVIIIAHSMGGLDARYMISKLGMADRVAALLTISTPHRGSPYADWCVKNLGQRLSGFRLMKLLNLDVQGLNDLTTRSCRAFNEEILDMPSVKYFSVSACLPRRRMPAFSLLSHRIVYQAEGDNDGLVSLKSAAWGEHLATWNASHWGAINRRFVKTRASAARSDIAPEYLKILDRVDKLL
jgi:triacylglycerol lipase